MRENFRNVHINISSMFTIYDASQSPSTNVPRPPIYRPQQVPEVLEFYEYKMKPTQTMGVFLAEFHQQWKTAQDFDITGSGQNLLTYLCDT